MTNQSIYTDIAARTGGDIYIGVVGPVRTGKSTFIKRFMDVMVIPNIAEPSRRDRANDELPQSASGRTIMTTEPKFIPEDAVDIVTDTGCKMSVRLIDCVGYIVPGSIGYIEGDQPRMVKTPWYDEPVPFNMAAEFGTHKVIEEHSTIGIVITTDGSIGDIAREDYVDAERRVISELKAINKPFVIVVNSTQPQSERARKLAADRGIFLPGNDRDRIALLIERNGKAAVRLAQKLRKIAQLEIVAAVDVVFVAVRIDAVDRQILRRSHHIRGGGIRHGNANQEQRQNDGQSLFHG